MDTLTTDDNSRTDEDLKSVYGTFVSQRCRCCRLHRRSGILWQVMLAVLAFTSLILTAHEISKMKLLLYNLQANPAPGVWCLIVGEQKVQLEPAHRKADVKKKQWRCFNIPTLNLFSIFCKTNRYLRKRRSSLPADFLPADVIPGPYSPQRGSVAYFPDTPHNSGLSPLRSRPQPTRDGELSSSQLMSTTNGDIDGEVMNQTTTDISNQSSSGTTQSVTSTSLATQYTSQRPTTSEERTPSSSGGGQTGSAFVRWGKPSCPQNTELVYTGYAAGAYPLAGFGGSTELECLPTTPEWSANASSPLSKTLISAAKFSLNGHSGVFSPSAENAVVVCTVCLSSRTPVLMIPGREECPTSWHREYHGYLMSTPGVSSHYYFSSKNYCVDRDPDFYLGHDDSHGLRLTFVQAGHCYQDKLPCRDYQMGRRMSCTVCSKVKSRYLG